MGQYYVVCNLDKKEYIKPDDFGDGAKLMEFANSAKGLLRALAVLLASGNNRGGGDLRSNHPIIGTWAGNRIVVAGDYGDEGLYVENSASITTSYGRVIETPNLYDIAMCEYKNVGKEVNEALRDGGEELPYEQG